MKDMCDHGRRAARHEGQDDANLGPKEMRNSPAPAEGAYLAIITTQAVDGGRPRTPLRAEMQYL